MADVANLLALLDAMGDNGTTLIVIEHNWMSVARADWIIDMGRAQGRRWQGCVEERRASC